MVLGTAVSTVGPLLLAGVIGFVKLTTKVDLYRAENTKDHKEISRHLKELNGTGHDNAEAIVALETTCGKNHPK